MRPTLRPGERPGDHVVRGVLGQGAMGAVFEVVHEPTGTRRAAKVLPAPLPGDEHALELAERFRRESRALARVSHPNVVGVHAAGVREDGLAWFALDLAEGGDLLGRLRAEGPLPIAEALRLGEGIARGLARVHAAGIVHRDLKAANVLLQGPERRPVITDFGIALSAEEERLTRAGELLGTPAAMAPEQVLGEHEQVGAPADVWALGALLYHMLAGRPPFQGGNLERLLVAIATTPPEPLRALRPEVPVELEALVLDALAREPGDRPDAETIADDLARLAGADARPRPRGPDPRPGAGGGRRLALGGALLAAALAAVGVAALRRPRSLDAEVAVTAAHAAARAARAADRLARLGLAPPADPAPLESALAALARVPAGAEEASGLAAARSSLGAALAERAVTAALAAHDPAAARAALERVVPGARRTSLAAAATAIAPPGPDTAATLDALVASLDPGPERIDALVASVDAALAAEDAPRARRLLGDAEGAAFTAGDDPGARAAAARVPRVLCAAALGHARALEAGAAVRALQEAARHDALAAREGAARASALAAARWRDDPGRRDEALALLDALLPLGPPARDAAPAWLARALGRREKEWRPFLGDLEAALRADPDARLPSDAEAHVHVAASAAMAETDVAAALRVLAAGLRLGLRLVIEADLLRAALSERALTRAIDAAGSDETWPLRLLRARRAADRDPEAQPLSTAEAERLLADARAVLAASHVSPSATVEARLQVLTAQARLDPAGHEARCEAAWADLPDRRRLALVALRGHQAARRYDAAAAWGPRLLEATRATAERTARGTLAEGEEGVSSLASRLQRAFDLHALVLVQAGRPAEVLTLSGPMAAGGVRVLNARVTALCELGRIEEAVAEAEEAHARAPGDPLVDKALETARSAAAARRR